MADEVMRHETRGFPILAGGKHITPHEQAEYIEAVSKAHLKKTLAGKGSSYMVLLFRTGLRLS